MFLPLALTAPQEALPSWLPVPAARLLAQLTSPGVLAALSVLSVLLLVLSVLGVSWAVQRLPRDYLVRVAPRPRAHGLAQVGRVARNVLGALLVLLGVLLLVLPGQGLLTIIVGLTLVDFPGKGRLERRLMRLPTILSTLNRLRARAGQPALITEPAEGAEASAAPSQRGPRA